MHPHVRHRHGGHRTRRVALGNSAGSTRPVGRMADLGERSLRMNRYGGVYSATRSTATTMRLDARRSPIRSCSNQATYAYDDNDRITSVTPPSPGSWYYYLADGLGSTMAVVDASGVVQDSYTYDVYGTPSKTGSLANEFDFAGQQTDGTGLQYLRARYYDPATGAFLSRDPLAASALSTGSAYGYAACSPVTFGDATGLKPVGSGEDERNMSAREKLCWNIANQMLKKIAEMREDRDVIEGRGSGRDVTDKQKTGKQKRWKNNQRGLNDLWGRFEHLDCANHIGTGWVPNDFDEQLCGEYPKFDASSKSWWNKLPDVDLEWPEVPEGIRWNDDDWWNPPIPVPAPGPVPAY
ncbi:MAG: RHS repeat-associated core domain-containing protein [Dehalococcoidia bacterium]|nr:RHS repeat-associated core domain-containing protein [Dehalococcoidia bacterium]